MATDKSLVSNSNVTPVVLVRPDSEDFFPTADGHGGYELKVGGGSEYTSLPPRMTSLLDLGLEIEIPEGLRVVVEVSAEWAKKGLMLAVAQQKRNRVILAAYNVGKQILAFQVGEVVGSYYFVEVCRAAVRP